MSTSTGSNANPKKKAHEQSISQRKQHHIDICREDSGVEIESRLKGGFSEVSFIHKALPEISVDDIDLSCDFLGIQNNLPLFISCMTGGSEEGRMANQELAKAASCAGIPVGIGSIRILLEGSSGIEDFQIKRFAPHVPLLANIGATQARDIDTKLIRELLKTLEAQALVVHLNCGQEFFQQNGDRNYKGLFDTIHRLVDSINLPLIVKETGFGISPGQIKKLINHGVAYVDLAGAGGTNWVLVEKSSRSHRHISGAEEFASWGMPTAMLLDATADLKGKILASGGLRSGMDLAKSLALGAVMGGMALPFIQAALAGGKDEVLEKINEIKNVLLAVMVMTGSTNLSRLKETPLVKTAPFEHYVRSLREAEEL